MGSGGGYVGDDAAAGAELKMWGDNVSRGCRIADPEQFD